MKKYLKTQSNGEAIEVLANDGAGSSIEAITADTTLTAADSGKTYILDATGEVITLPAVAAGLKFKFICSAATATTDWTIVSATNVIQGSAIVAGAVVPAADENTISLVATKTLPGDFVEVVSDGTNWYAFGNAVTAAAITFTAP
jgi:hypothetical protein